MKHESSGLVDGSDGLGRENVLQSEVKGRRSGRWWEIAPRLKWVLIRVYDGLKINGQTVSAE